MKNQPRIAGVIAVKTLEEVGQLIDKAKIHTDWIELRADYISDLDNQKIADLALLTQDLRVIFTLRDVRYGGNFNGLETERLMLFEYALSKNFEFYDVDFEAVEEYFPLIQNMMDKVILSYHNFSETPESSILLNVYDSMKIFNPGIVKIATSVKEQIDLETLQQLVVQDTNQAKIVVGMGEMAKLTRITFPLLGSFLTFAAVDQSQSAPGQLALQDLKHIYSEIFNLLK